MLGKSQIRREGRKQNNREERHRKKSHRIAKEAINDSNKNRQFIRCSGIPTSGWQPHTMYWNWKQRARRPLLLLLLLYHWQFRTALVFSPLSLYVVWQYSLIVYLSEHMHAHVRMCLIYFNRGIYHHQILITTTHTHTHTHTIVTISIQLQRSRLSNMY